LWKAVIEASSIAKPVFQIHNPRKSKSKNGENKSKINRIKDTKSETMECRDCRFIDYFTLENRYWCHMKKDYINHE
jgi:hypothetical protein